MLQSLTHWFWSRRQDWLLGLGAWALLGVGGAVHAHFAQLPALQVIVTWNEWFAALLLLPLLFTGRMRGNPLARKAYAAVLVVFALDLLVRALFGLGWQPFLLG
ncbi:MAG: hypothetical protein ACOY93_16645 [Bacillota bacterium]